jgi:DeoR/GlpR family transcriptional regulator of sugar metabolism
MSTMTRDERIALLAALPARPTIREWMERAGVSRATAYLDLNERWPKRLPADQRRVVLAMLRADGVTESGDVVRVLGVSSRTARRRLREVGAKPHRIRTGQRGMPVEWWLEEAA